MGPTAEPNVLQKKKTLAPTGIPTELSGCWKRRNLYKTVAVNSDRMSDTSTMLKRLLENDMT